MRWVIGLSAAVIATTAGCGGADAPAEPPRTVTVTVTAPAPPPPATIPPSVRDPVGSNLQDAQNAVQDLTEFQVPVTTSHDSTGAGRQQVMDRNWKVCSQSV